jgi:hypothetical protein
MAADLTIFAGAAQDHFMRPFAVDHPERAMAIDGRAQ